MKIKIFNNIIGNTIRKRLRNVKPKLSSNHFELEVKRKKVVFKHILHDSIFIIVGVFAASFGLNAFLLPNMFIDGGVTGISLIVAEVTDLPLSILLIAINLPFIILGFSSIGKQFAFRSIIAISMLAIVVHLVNYPAVTDDKLLVAVFGGFFLGLGIGLSIRGGAVIDGTEVLAIFIGRRTAFTIGDVIAVFNVTIFSVAAYVFDIETALYAMLTYLAASKTVDFVVSGLEEYVGVTIISDFNDDIRNAIIDNLGRGCTLYQGKKGATLEEIDILYTLITRLEIAKLKTEVDKIDENAFLVMHSIKDAKGGMIKKRKIH